MMIRNHYSQQQPCPIEFSLIPYNIKQASNTVPHPLSSKSRVKNACAGFPGGAVVKNPPANAGDTGSSPGPGRSHMPQSH